MTAEIAPGGSGWSVEYQQESTQVGTGNRVVQGFTVGFVTGLGAHGSVFVPRDTYTPDAVRLAIAAQAAQLDAIATLTSQS